MGLIPRWGGAKNDDFRFFFGWEKTVAKIVQIDFVPASWSGNLRSSWSNRTMICSLVEQTDSSLLFGSRLDDGELQLPMIYDLTIISDRDKTRCYWLRLNLFFDWEQSYWRGDLQIGFLSLREKTSTRLAFSDFNLSLEGMELEKFEFPFLWGKTNTRLPCFWFIPWPDKTLKI